MGVPCGTRQGGTVDVKIVSGGETGAERAALDAAIRWGVPYGGWVRKGRKTEDGTLPVSYDLKEMPTTSAFQWRKQNILYAYGTVIFTHGEPEGETASTAEMVRLNSRPLLNVDLSLIDASEAGRMIRAWVREHKIKILNVTGTTAGKDPEIYRKVTGAFEAAFQTEMSPEGADPALAKYSLPKTVDEAVERLIEELPVKTRILIARMDETELGSLPFSLVRFMRERLDSWLDSDRLMESCKDVSGDDKMHVDYAPVLILRALWTRLRKDYGIQAIKAGR